MHICAKPLEPPPRLRCGLGAVAIGLLHVLIQLRELCVERCMQSSIVVLPLICLRLLQLGILRLTHGRRRRWERQNGCVLLRGSLCIIDSQFILLIGAVETPPLLADAAPGGDLEVVVKLDKKLAAGRVGLHHDSVEPPRFEQHGDSGADRRQATHLFCSRPNEALHPAHITAHPHPNTRHHTKRKPAGDMAEADTPAPSDPFGATFADDAFADFESAFPDGGGDATAFADVSDPQPAATPQPPAVAVSAPAAPSGDDAKEDEERREFERQRQKRLQKLEQQREEQLKKAVPTSTNSSWGGWLSSMPTITSPAMDFNALSKAATEQAERAAAALQSPGVASGLSSLADIRGKLQKEAEKLQMQSPVATLSSLGKNLEKNLEGLSMDPSKWGRRASSGSATEASGGGVVDASATGGPSSAGGTATEDDEAAAAAAAAKAARKAEKKKKKKAPETEQEMFDALMEERAYGKAAAFAAGSPKQELRTLDTIRRFQSAPPAEEGGQAPILAYFGALLQAEGALSDEEGVELARPVVQQGQLELLQRWISQGKLAPTVALADVIREGDVGVALAVYKKAGAPHATIIRCYAELGDVEEVCLLCHESEPPTRPNWVTLLGEICARTAGAPRALALDEKLRSLPPPPPPPDPEDELAVMAYNMNPQRPPPPTRAESVTVFLDHGCVRQATKIGLDALSPSVGDGGGGGGLPRALQTRLLAENVAEDRQVGEALLESGSFSDFDTTALAQRCEAAGLLRHALRLHAAPEDVARVMSHDEIDDAAASARVGAMAPADGRAAIASLLRHGRGANVLSKVLAISRDLVGHIGHAELVAAFNEAGSERGLLCYLASRVSAGADGGVTLEYVRAAKRAGRADEVERITRDRAIPYAPRDMLTLLLEDGASADPRPIINLCDRFEMVEEMARLFHEQRKLGHLSLYVRKVDPSRTPQVVAGLLDAGCEPPKVAELVAHVDLGVMALDETLAARLIAACDERGQLALLRPWLEARVAEGLVEGRADHTAVRQALKKVKGFLGGLLG